MTSYSLLVTRCRSHTYLHTHEYRVHARMYIAPLTSKYIRFGRSHLTVFSPPCYPSFLETPLLSHSPLLLPGVWSDSCFAAGAGGLGDSRIRWKLDRSQIVFVFRTPYCCPNILGVYIIIQLTIHHTEYTEYYSPLVLRWIGEDGDHLSIHKPLRSSQCSCRESRPYHDLNSNWQ